MAPLPDNNTIRIKVTYQNQVANHDVLFRITDIGELPQLEADIADILTALSGEFHFSEIVNVEQSLAGSDFFFPIPSSPLIGITWGTGAASDQTNATFLQFGGRSSGGRRTKFYLYGYEGVFSDFRVTGAENTAIADTVTILNSSTERFVAIDGNPTEWYNYANTNFNDHWVKTARNG